MQTSCHPASGSSASSPSLATSGSELEERPGTTTHSELAVSSTMTLMHTVFLMLGQATFGNRDVQSFVDLSNARFRWAVRKFCYPDEHRDQISDPPSLCVAELTSVSAAVQQGFTTAQDSQTLEHNV